MHNWCKQSYGHIHPKKKGNICIFGVFNIMRKKWLSVNQGKLLAFDITILQNWKQSPQLLDLFYSYFELQDIFILPTLFFLQSPSYFCGFCNCVDAFPNSEHLFIHHWKYSINFISILIYIIECLFNNGTPHKHIRFLRIKAWHKICLSVTRLFTIQLCWCICVTFKIQFLFFNFAP